MEYWFPNKHHKFISFVAVCFITKTVHFTHPEFDNRPYPTNLLRMKFLNQQENLLNPKAFLRLVLSFQMKWVIKISRHENVFYWLHPAWPILFLKFLQGDLHKVFRFAEIYFYRALPTCIPRFQIHFPVP